MEMRRILALLLAVLLTVFLTACGKTDTAFGAAMGTGKQSACWRPICAGE